METFSGVTIDRLTLLNSLPGAEEPFINWKSISERHIIIFDISDGPDHPDILIQTSFPTLEQLSKLPTQTAHSCRLYIVHNPEENEVFRTHIEQVTSSPFHEFYSKTSEPIRPPLIRRLENGQMTWWQDGIYIFGFHFGVQGLFGNMVRCHVTLRCIWRENHMLCKLHHR